MTRTRDGVPVVRREFTDDDRVLMQRQAAGEFSMHRLERLLATGRGTLIRYMNEIGLTPVIGESGARRLKPVEPEHAEEGDSNNASPTVGKGDEKFGRLLEEHHGGRRYGTIDPVTARRARQ